MGGGGGRGKVSPWTQSVEGSMDRGQCFRVTLYYTSKNVTASVSHVAKTKKTNSNHLRILINYVSNSVFICRPFH